MSYAMQFPGQGSQALGMLNNLADGYPLVKETITEAAQVLGYDLWALITEGPEDKLNQTEYTQPALLAASVATWRVWCEANGPAPAFMAGHSLGEYSALVCADAISFADGLKLVERRGQLMQAAVPEGQGAMAALIGLADDDVRQVCSDAANGGVLEAVNFNAPGQVVIAGERALVESAVELASERGARMTKLLPVSVPSHCALMKDAASELGEALGAIDIQSPKVPVLHNVDATARNSAEDIRQALVAQLHSPVLWVPTVQSLVQEGVSGLVECGPGRVLTGLARRIERSLKNGSLHDAEGLDQALELVNTAA